jgi:GGDEF domain-containing protein
MSIIAAKRKRTALYLSAAGILVMFAAVSAISARDPDGLWLRVGITMVVAGASLWLPWQALLPVTLAIWLAPNYLDSRLESVAFLNTNMLLELPGLLGLAGCAHVARRALRKLEDEDLLIGASREDLVGIDQATGVYEERLLRPAFEAELVRSRRFERQFALVLVGLDELRQRFDYRNDEQWRASFIATGQLLRGTRTHIDRVYRYGETGFAMLQPESGDLEVLGLVRRLRRVANRAAPDEGEPGGPLASHYGATFFPHCATSVEDLFRRAEVTLRMADKQPNRLQLDGAEAQELPAPSTLRRAEVPAATDAGVALLEQQVYADADMVMLTPSTSLSSVEESPAPVFAAAGVQPALAVGETMTPTGEGAPMERSVSDLLKHMDETLDLIRSLRTRAAA